MDIEAHQKIAPENDTKGDHRDSAAKRTKARTVSAEDDLTDGEVSEVKHFLGEAADDKLKAQEVLEKLKGWAPAREGYFSSRRRMLLLGATWMVKSGHYLELKNREGDPLFGEGCDSFYGDVGLGDRKNVSRELNRQRLYELFPAHLKARVKGPGCIDPLLTLNHEFEAKRSRAFEALSAWKGELTAIVAEAAMQLSTGPTEPNLSAAMNLKVGIRQNDTIRETLTNMLKRITSEAPACYALAKELIESVEVEKPILVPGLTKPSQDAEDPKRKVAEATARSGHDKVETKRADIVITPEMVTVTIDKSGRAPDLLMGLVKNKSFGFHKTKKSKQCGSTPEEQKPVWVSAENETTPAGKMLRAALLTL